MSKLGYALTGLEYELMMEFVRRVDEDGADVTESAWELYYDFDSHVKLREIRGEEYGDKEEKAPPIPASAAYSYATLLQSVRDGDAGGLEMYSYRLHLSLSSRGRMYHRKDNRGESIKLWR